MSQQLMRKELPRYKCHKEVEAVKIEAIHHFGSMSALVWFPSPDENARVMVGPEYMAKHDPKVGGYYVRYADGYESFSPAAAFEEGYSHL